MSSNGLGSFICVYSFVIDSTSSAGCVLSVLDSLCRLLNVLPIHVDRLERARTLRLARALVVVVDDHRFNAWRVGQNVLDDPAVNEASVDVIVARSLDKLHEIEVDKELAEIQRRMPFETEEEKTKSLRRRDELLSSRKGKGKYKGFVHV